MTVKINIIGVLAALFVTGCAGYSAKPITSSTEDDKATGIRYYEQAPFLLVYSDGKGNLTSQVLMMPDTSKKMEIDLHAFMSKNNSTLTFNEGVLTDSKFVLDSTDVPSKLVDTIRTLGTAAVKSALNEPGKGTTRAIPAPYLFKIVVGKNGTKLVGGQGEDKDGNAMTISVSVTNEETLTGQAASESSKGGTK